MSEPILVVGLAGLPDEADVAEWTSGLHVVARSRAALAGSAFAGLEVHGSYDDLLETAPLSDVAATIASDLAGLIRDRDVAYVVHGYGAHGDESVAALARVTRVTFAPLFVNAGLGHVQFIDALTLAVAAESAPFEAGNPPLDPTAPLVVCNWHGARVIALAIRRLRDLYGDIPLPDARASTPFTIPPVDTLAAPASFSALARIVARLRMPDGCPWDREQTHASLIDGFASEVAELRDAIEREDWPNAAEELGDLLLNVLMQTQIGAEQRHFTLEDVLAGVNAKLVRRHPHVFGDVVASSPDEVLAVWRAVKRRESGGVP